MNAPKDKSLLLIAIGNSGRQDDGLGWAFADALKDDDRFAANIEYRYQLQVEDAELISCYDQVVFVDAYRGDRDITYEYQPCSAKGSFHFTTHALDLESVLFLCREVYDHVPDAWQLAIKGYTWELETGLSGPARQNLEKAVAFFFSRKVT